MSRWHLPNCGNPMVTIQQGTPRCLACRRSPPKEPACSREQSGTFVQPPPDESLGHLNLWWPSTVAYHGAAPTRTSPAPGANAPVGLNRLETTSSTRLVAYHQRLRYNEIRLIHLSPSPFENAPLHFGLATYRDNDYPDYEAISYTWGDDTGDSTPCVPVYIGLFWDVLFQTRNCAAMLRYVRRPDAQRALWVDAICINQADTEEKVMQIPKMGSIYKRCLRVLVYLGEKAAEAPRNRRRRFPKRAPISALVNDRRTLFKMLRSRYFSRLWVIQELVLARHVVFVHEGCEYHAEALSTAQIPFEKTSSPWLSYMARQSILAKDGFVGAITLTGHAACADARDKVFGILGLVEGDQAELFRPDYTLSALHVFVGLFSHCVINSGHVGRVLYNSIGIPGWNTQPSWVPNWGGEEGSLSLRLLHLCALQQSLRRLETLHAVDGLRRLHLYTSWTQEAATAILFLARDSELDKLANPKTDHIFFAGPDVPLLMRKLDDADGNYKIVAPLHSVFLVRHGGWSREPLGLNLFTLLDHHAVESLKTSPPRFTPERELDDPYLEKLDPITKQRRETRIAQRLSKQLFPGATTAEAILPTLQGLLEQRRDNEKVRYKAPSFSRAFDEINKSFLASPLTDDHPQQQRDTEFISFVFQPEAFSDVSRYYCTSLFSTAEDPEGSLRRKEENLYRIQELPHWEWQRRDGEWVSLLDAGTENNNHRVEELTRFMLSTTQRRTTTTAGGGGGAETSPVVRLRTKRSAVEHFLYWYTWETQVLKRLGRSSRRNELQRLYELQGGDAKHLEWRMRRVLNSLRSVVDLDFLPREYAPHEWPVDMIGQLGVDGRLRFVTIF
ncbi:heterokaryon incompatibility protein-domain-containing protein [Echria macrotheca]|uniref:Heterokaryon incompatibility protein-domain-containing protein n=1 Tax=Echria macrotheca TaxID=438768 RepID=A0AAJ0F8V7_9PEZI|nr:heterokaryon incompatibility protein-domain-containing protein [Echria macrotheca]